MFKKNFYLLTALLVLVFASCQRDDNNDTVSENYLGKKASDFDATVTTGWYAHTLNLVKTTSGYSPPVASRAFGYIGVALYETVRPGTNYKTTVGQLSGLENLPKPENNKEYYWPAAANAALATINTLFFPRPEAKAVLVDSISTIRAYYKTQFQKEGVSDEVIRRSELFGEAMANAVFEWSKTDVIGHEGFRKNYPAGFELPKFPGAWEPTGSQIIPLQPYWGFVRAFVPGSINVATPAPPIPYNIAPTSAFYAQAKAVYDKSKSLTNEEKRIALYWADGGGTITPPGHSIAITSQLVAENNDRLDKAADAYLRVGIAVADAFICCWKCKYVYNLMRPVTYIKNNIDKDWKPLIATPPFPEYTSGHSSQSGATAYVLAKLYGADISFTDKTHQKRTDIDGSPRSYKNFMEMAAEAAESRLYGGIHFPMGNMEGLSSGLKIGKAHDNLITR
jgi:hypothetical protein